MFQDGGDEYVNFSSTWKADKLEYRTAGTQTSVILADDKSIQSIEKHHVEVQTEESEVPHLAVNDQPLDEKAVVGFLNRVYPMVSQQLNEAIGSRAFDDYDVDWSEDFGGLELLHTLSESSLSSEIGVSDVSWSSTGTVVAVAYGRLDHEHLCAHKGGVCTWSISRLSGDSSKADTILDSMSCVMCVAFHPTHPAIICAGTYNGDLLVWDVSKQDNKLCFNSRPEESHLDPVSDVIWTVDAASRGKKYQIQSVGSDGKIITWALPNQSNHLEIVVKHALHSESIPRSLRGGASGTSAQFGASCVSFSTFDRRQFIVGCDSGNLFKCNLGKVHQPSSNKGLRSPDSASGSKHSSKALDSQNIKSPITFPYTPNKGPVYGVSCSPFHRNAFLACGTDGCLHFYSALQARPLLSADPDHGYLFGVQWSPARPLVCALGTADGHILLYDLLANQVHPALTLQGSTDKQAVVSVQFNVKRPQYLLCGNVGGQAQVHRLPRSFAHPSRDEEHQLSALLSA